MNSLEKTAAGTPNAKRVARGFNEGAARMYANPVERERMLIEQALRTQAKWQAMRNDTRQQLNSVFNQ